MRCLPRKGTSGPRATETVPQLCTPLSLRIFYRSYPLLANRARFRRHYPLALLNPLPVRRVGTHHLETHVEAHWPICMIPFTFTRPIFLSLKLQDFAGLSKLISRADLKFSWSRFGRESWAGSKPRSVMGGWCKERANSSIYLHYELIGICSNMWGEVRVQRSGPFMISNSKPILRHVHSLWGI